MKACYLDLERGQIGELGKGFDDDILWRQTGFPFMIMARITRGQGASRQGKFAVDKRIHHWSLDMELVEVPSSADRFRWLWFRGGRFAIHPF